MFLLSEKYKGIHPGIVLDRELKKRSIKQRPFALSLNEHPQTFNAIIKAKRNLPTSLALKIEKQLNFEEGDLVLLQAFFDIKKEKEKLSSQQNDVPTVRKILFWDINFDKIDWSKNYKMIIKRIFERGNEREKSEIINFYGHEKITKALNSNSTEPMKLHDRNGEIIL
ncbi:Plasmid maintenance system antidote protein VapI, contains XRE-type HTH domain [Chishuiella changwenlii]|uniref:Plasmid maintenance system antidote protein VapI, contains XRE-type HTH domain n=1 Tax=Chishuiella changwenlii TaxID=1434701 RepID=A0A1M7CBY4_9FLAO|nr:plasmid maintenance system antidote protein [Chishuiella changwenlii]GGF06510.1 hypothetical protein GCM10010984_24730 [Chishuiella changwenlii]SHL64731.1 Plasmid maintenance system antidote protein VapI, contains XRE-type HTH domain [Chishuiella changwenlii]